MHKRLDAQTLAKLSGLLGVTVEKAIVNSKTKVLVMKTAGEPLADKISMLESKLGVKIIVYRENVQLLTQKLAEKSEEFAIPELYGIQEKRRVKLTGFLRKLNDIWFLYDEESQEAVVVSFNSYFVNQESVTPNVRATVHGIYDPEANMLVADIVETEAVEQDDFIDLHVYSKYTEFGSVIDINELAEEFKRRGRKHVCITDVNAVHGFPVLQNAAGESAIYGTELSVLATDAKDAVVTDEDFRLSTAEYVVFDLETTGTSKRFDQIVEIGAVKIKNGVIVDRFHTLVKPTIEMSQVSSQITSISQEMLENAPLLEEVWPKFKKFIEGAVLVAHNAEFDVGFLKAIEPIDNPYIDTLKLAKALVDSKRYGLKALAKKFKVGDFTHHRALDDAETLAKIFINLLSIAFERGVFTAEELNRYCRANASYKDRYAATFIVRNETGLKNLYRLVSRAHTENLKRFGVIAVTWDDVEELRDGLFVASGLPGSELFEAVNENADEETLLDIAERYDYIELIYPDSHIDSTVADSTNKMLVNLAKKAGKPAVLVSAARYLYPSDRPAFEALVTSKRSKNRDLVHANPHIITKKEALRYIMQIAPDMAKTIVEENPKALVSMIESVTVVKTQFEPPAIDGAAEKLRELATEALKKYYGDNPPDIVMQRFNKELDSLIKYGFADLYIIAHDVIKHSEAHGYEVGSRGSVGSSFIAWLLGITEINPLPAHYNCPECSYTEFNESYHVGMDMPEKRCPVCGSKMSRYGFNIPFEVFTGFEGDKLPDIDLNIADEFQEQSHQFLRQMFGEDRVIRAGTIATVSSRTKFAIAADYCDEKNKSDATRRMIAEIVEGVKTGTGQHPGGLLVVPKGKEVYDFTPIQHPANDTNEPVTSHFEYEHLHDWIAKVDLLGHQTPTILKILHKLTGVDPKHVDYSDPKVLALFYKSEVDLSPLSTVDTIGVPEFNTPFVRGVLEATRPKTVDDLIRISGLTHGTGNWFDNADNLIRSGTATLRDVVGARDDIMLTLIEKGGDRKWAFEVMERVRKGKGLREEDIAEMRRLGLPEWYIESLKKIVYLFPRAHAAAYTVMSLRIAWFKVYYPVAFYCAVLSKKNSISHKYYFMSKQELVNELLKRQADKTPQAKAEISDIELIFDAKAHGIKFYAPDVTVSDSTNFLPYEDGIILPLVAIDGVGTTLAENIVTERSIRRFTSKEDFVQRCKPNKKQLAVLEEAGALRNLQNRQITLFA